MSISPLEYSCSLMCLSSITISIMLYHSINPTCFAMNLTKNRHSSCGLIYFCVSCFLDVFAFSILSILAIILTLCAETSSTGD